ncbi:hypothetical protein VFPPC_17737 [Pochonia chlamydosporia 170]|uniref:Uncharacterized protein n=1 Tax=Pochonia chlamydosporia 170 TaxID=1380566 RepID=A0A219AQM7_METCM|nr:hypothetical protein VFPPC_17737 [Pochonia chlamydosporia 170]OWT43087.1 hypothetical protein VFPPC_17737 [Pochonia chlamydosporia 170]
MSVLCFAVARCSWHVAQGRQHALIRSSMQHATAIGQYWAVVAVMRALCQGHQVSYQRKPCRNQTSRQNMPPLKSLGRKGPSNTCPCLLALGWVLLDLPTHFAWTIKRARLRWEGATKRL